MSHNNLAQQCYAVSVDTKQPPLHNVEVIVIFFFVVVFLLNSNKLYILRTCLSEIGSMRRCTAIDGHNLLFLLIWMFLLIWIILQNLVSNLNSIEIIDYWYRLKVKNFNVVIPSPLTYTIYTTRVSEYQSIRREKP